MCMLKFLAVLVIALIPYLSYGDAVIFSGKDVKSLKTNLDLFGTSKLMGLNVDPRAGAGVAAPLSSIGMDYLTGNVYFKSGVLDTDWTSISGSILIPGQPNTFAGYNASGLLQNIPGWSFDPTFFGAQVNLNADPPNTVTYTAYNNWGMNLNPTQASPDNANAIWQFGTSVDQGNTGFGLGANGLAVKNLDNAIRFQGSGANGSVQLFNNNLDLGNSGTPVAGSITGADLFDNGVFLHNGYTIGTNGVTGQNLQLNSEVGSTMQGGLNGYSLSYNLLGDVATVVGGFNGYTVGGEIKPTNTPSAGMTSFISFLNLDTSLNNANIFSDNTNLGSSAAITIPNYTSFQAGAHLFSGSTLTNFQGENISLAVDAGATINNYTGLNIGQNINSAATVNQFTGLQINAASYTLASGFHGTAIDSQGMHNFFNPVDFPAGFNGFIPNLNNMGGNFHIVSGSPVTGLDAFGNNLAWTLTAEDDVGVGPAGLGVSAVGFVGQLDVRAGKTFSPSFSFAFGGASVPPTSTGGSIAGEVAMFNAVGIINSGGTLSIANQTSFLMPTGFNGCGFATSCWGVKIAEPAADNSFAKNVIIEATQPTNASVGLEINSTTKALLESRMSTAQRLALTAVNGMRVYDSTLNQFMCYEAGSWKQCIPSSVAAACPVRAVAVTDTATNADCIIHATSTYTQTLYAPADGDAICVKNAGAGTISLDVVGGAFIDDELTQTLYHSASACFYGFGGNWYVK